MEKACSWFQCQIHGLSRIKFKPVMKQHHRSCLTISLQLLIFFRTVKSINWNPHFTIMQVCSICTMFFEMHCQFWWSLKVLLGLFDMAKFWLYLILLEFFLLLKECLKSAIASKTNLDRCAKQLLTITLGVQPVLVLGTCFLLTFRDYFYWRSEDWKG